MTRRIAALLACTLAVAACGRGGGNEIAELDNELLANGADPALTSALEDQILVDPNLVQQAHPNSVRPPEAPVQAQYPPRRSDEGSAPGEARPAARQAAASVGGEVAPCGAAFQRGPGWARRLPAEFPLYPGGRIVEAAGTQTPGCQLRVVTFETGDSVDRVLAYYRGAAGRAGFSAEQQRRGADLVLGGFNPRTDGAYLLIVTPRTNGAEVALIVNNGR